MRVFLNPENVFRATGGQRAATQTGQATVTGCVFGESVPAVCKSGRLHLEDSMQANRNNEDAPEEHHEIADAEQSQPRLVCEK